MLKGTLRRYTASVLYLFSIVQSRLNLSFSQFHLYPQRIALVGSVLILISGGLLRSGRSAIVDPGSAPSGPCAPGKHNASPADRLPDLIILLVIGIVLIPLGLWVFHLGEMYAKKTGKLKRSG